MLLNAPLSPSWRAALRKSSSCAIVPTGTPLAVATSCCVKRLVPVTLTAISLYAVSGMRRGVVACGAACRQTAGRQIAERARSREARNRIRTGRGVFIYFGRDHTEPPGEHAKYKASSPGKDNPAALR